jgi:carbamoylphosphate synthase large subunit
VTEARALGWETLLLNCNPETVSTDYDVCDRLIFDEISLESVLAICAAERPDAVVVSMGGQTANNLALALDRSGITVLGTSPTSIDRAENRDAFSSLLDELGIDQPAWARAGAASELSAVVERIGGLPVLVRPSYVLSGAAMKVVWSADTLQAFVGGATRVSPEHPVVISKFELDALEIELDAVARQGEIVVSALSEHIERAGVHSGDATMVFPAQGLSRDVRRQALDIGRKLARALSITGPFNVQLLVKDGQVKVIECNLRASRSLPFVSKVLGLNFSREAMRAMLGAEPSRDLIESNGATAHVAVKAAKFSFDRLRGAVPRLGVEMTSTGEVAAFGETRSEALLTAMLATGFRIPTAGALLAFDGVTDSFSVLEEARWLAERGLRLFALPETARSLQSLPNVGQVRADDGSAESLLRDRQVDAVFTASTGLDDRSAAPVLRLERLAIDLGIPVVSEPVLVRAVIQAIASTPVETLRARSWRHYLQLSADATRRGPAVRSHGGLDPARLRLFVRQPLTQTSSRELPVLEGVFRMLAELGADGPPLELLGAVRAEGAETFRAAFTRQTGLLFTAEAFRRTRLEHLRRADAMLVIRTGISESGAFEMAYNIFGGVRAPMFVAVWDQAPIRTTLLQSLDDLCPVRYVTFSQPEELRRPLLSFLNACVGGEVRATRHSTRQPSCL